MPRFLRGALSTLPLMVLVGCIKSPHVDANSMSCNTDDNCLVGYTCIAGTCQGPGGSNKDAGGNSQADAAAPSEGDVAGVDASAESPQPDATMANPDAESPAERPVADVPVSGADGTGGAVTGTGGATTDTGGVVGTGGVMAGTGGGGTVGGSGGTGGASGTGCSPPTNPDNPCQTCQVSTGTWTSVTDGASCGSGKVCNQGSCILGCFVGGTVYPEGTASPSSACQSCQSGTSTSTWTNLAGGASCDLGKVCNQGSCISGCFVGGTVYPEGTASPGSACQSCQSGTSTSTWTNLAGGTSCGSGKVCKQGSCISGCFVGGTVYAEGTASPENPCQSCQSATSTSAFSRVADGLPCGGGQYCGGGQCGTECTIGGIPFVSGTVNAANACASCQPATNSSAWSPRPDGTSCATGKVCATGSCVSSCYIDGSLQTSGTANPTNGCQTCQPSVSTTAWSSIADGTSCGTQAVCNDGSCDTGCFIGTTVYAPGAANPTNGCQTCQPSVSTTAWTTSADDTWCGAGQVCKTGACVHQVVFSYTGAAQNWVVPAGITQVTVTAAGAEGGADANSDPGGKGAWVTATVAVTPGETLVVTVGGAGGFGALLTPGPGGFNGGASGGATASDWGYSGGGGGGASDVRRGGTALANRIVVAGGGGGGGVDSAGGRAAVGGPGGAVGGSGADIGLSKGGAGGTATGGGTGGAAGDPAYCGLAGGAGALGVGGPGGADTCGYGSGAGGGGGYYGGGGGGGGQNGAGGGGGSSYASGTGVAISSGVQTGNGQVVVIY